MGANLGARVDTAPHPANPHGHWEHLDVWQGQERLLQQFGREWHSCPGPLPSRWLEWPDTTALMSAFAAIASSELAQHGHWVVKDPRSSLLIPLWREVARRCGCPLKLLRLYRSAEEVAASLAARDRMPRERALRIWADHQRAIATDSVGVEMQTFHHRELMEDPVTTFTEVARFTGLSGLLARVSDAAALVEGQLWHQREEGSGPTPVVRAPLPQPPVQEDPAQDLGTVAIVMRTRWRLHLLPRALRSVLSQSYPHWHLQIVNDGGSAHLVESEVEPYRHLLHGRLGILHWERQRGMEAASNAGIDAAPGAFIAIHDDDDSWSPDFLLRMLTWMRAHGHRAAVSRSRVLRERWDANGYRTYAVEEFGPRCEVMGPESLEAQNLFPPISFLFEREVYRQAGPFHEGLPALGDWHFNRRVAALHPIGVCPEALANWHLRDVRDRFPNSPPHDHWRMHGFVRQGPALAEPPGFFGEARQVHVWDRTSKLEGWEPLGAPGGGGSLAPGVYLLRVPLPVGAAAAAASSPGLFEFRAHGDEAPPEVARLDLSTDDPSHLLLNAPRPVTGLRVRDGAGRWHLLADAALALRLGEALPALEGFSASPRLPDVLCIGAQRSGTTWLHAALQGHPGVWTCPIKEFHHFDWDGKDPVMGEFRQLNAVAWLRDARAEARSPDAVRTLLRHGFPSAHSWASYSSLFESAPPGQRIFDFTPAYATLDEATVREIHRVMPALKVIFILRDPVTRAVSGALHALARQGGDRPSLDQLRAACEHPSNVLRTDYVRTLEAWQRHFPPEQFLVLFHDDIARDPAGLLARVCAFSGLAPPEAGRLNAQGLGQVRNAGELAAPWRELAQLKEGLSARWLPMLLELERRFGQPVQPWRRAAEARIRASHAARAGFGAGGRNTVSDNLAQWDVHHAWTEEGDEWAGQAAACGVPYQDWKKGMVERYQPLGPRGGTVLELGPGHGRWSEALVERAGLLVLCDVSPNCLDACRQRLAGRGRLRTHLSGGSDLPGDLSGAVDAVWSYDCLVHVGPLDFQQYLVEMARVLKPGGIAVLHHANRERGLRRALGDWLGRAPARGGARDADHGWRSPVSSADVRAWATAAGLTVERQERTWKRWTPQGVQTVGVPRFGDCISVLRKPARQRRA
jgi:SAM-dependent methyltransferase